jgi:hypothetical protein
MLKGCRGSPGLGGLPPKCRSFAVVSPGKRGQTTTGKRTPMLGKWPIPNKLSGMPAWAIGRWIRRVLVHLRWPSARAQEGQLEAPSRLVRVGAFSYLRQCVSYCASNSAGTGLCFIWPGAGATAPAFFGGSACRSGPGGAMAGQKRRPFSLGRSGSPRFQLCRPDVALLRSDGAVERSTVGAEAVADMLAGGVVESHQQS